MINEYFFKLNFREEEPLMISIEKAFYRMILDAIEESFAFQRMQVFGCDVETDWQLWKAWGLIATQEEKSKAIVEKSLSLLSQWSIPRLGRITTKFGSIKDSKERKKIQDIY